MMPSTTRPFSCSGWGRRTLSNRRTSASSFASRNTTYGCAPMDSSSASADFRSVENARLRTSTTAATRGTAALARRARSSIVTSMAGGRLSATNQSRSSSDLAAVDRPAPDMPVMITISGAPPKWSIGLLPLIGLPAPIGLLPLIIMPQRLRHRLGKSGSEPADFCDLLGGRRTQLAHRAEVLEQSLSPGGPETWQVVKLADRLRRTPLGAVVGDREPVRLVAYALEQVEALAGTRQYDRAVFAGQPHFFEALGKPAHRHVGDPEVGERP